MTLPRRVLVDTNVIIEAVRTVCWRAVTGGLQVETVEACRGEALVRPHPNPSNYVAVTVDDLSRLHEVHTVSTTTLAAFKLAYEDADGLDVGEHDLLAFAHACSSEEWVLASPDKAAIRALVALGLGDRMVSLEQVAKAVGARAKPPLREQFTARWLVSFRSQVRVEGL